MKKAFGIIVIALLVILFIGMGLSSIRIPAANAVCTPLCSGGSEISTSQSSGDPSQTSINNAIAKGLAYLNSTQDPDGSWNESYYFPVASTAMAVLAFENNGHYGWNSSDPYHTTVQNGLNWLLYNASAGAENVSLSNWSTNCAGNPYVGGATQGVGWYGDYYGEYSCYETPMVLLAIIASNAQTNVTSPGPLGVLTYKALADEIVSWIAWAQNSNATYLQEYGEGYWLGGWRYSPQYGESDNSVSGWPVLGLLAAQLWGINAPSWVKTELAQWTTTDQDMTGNASTNSLYGSFGYTGRDEIYGGVPETAEGIAEMTYLGYPDTYANITAAEGYLYRDWYVYDADFQVNNGSLYSMYGVMKAMRETIPTPTKFITNYNGTASIEWYNGTGQYAYSLVSNQSADGSWINWQSWAEADDYSTALTTAMGVLILQGGISAPVVVHYNLNVTVLNAATLLPIVGANVSITGPESLSSTTNANGQIAFNSILAGGYTVTTSMTGYVANTTFITLTSNYALTVKLQPIPSVVQWTLTVASAHNSPMPGVGVHTYLNGTSVTCNVTSPVVESGVSYTCTGWTGTGSVPSSGTGVSVTFTITENSSITWNWIRTPPAPDFSISTSPSSLTIVQGSSLNSTINVTSLYGFSGVVNLTASGAPIGVTLTLSPTSVTLVSGGFATSTLMVAVNKTTMVGNYTLTVTGRSGSLIHNATISLTVQPRLIKVCVKFKPEKLNLKSEGKWIICFIKFPEGYNVSNVNASTIMLNGTIPASRVKFIWNCDHTEVVGLMVEFNRTEVEQFILEATHLTKGCMKVKLTVTGSLKDGTLFQGTGTIKVTLPHHHYHHHRCNDHHKERCCNNNHDNNDNNQCCDNHHDD